MNKEISLHTIATYNDKEYELQDLLNNLLNELQRKDKNWNELKKYLEYEIAEWQDVDNIPTKARVEEDREILDKIKELEENK